MSILLVDSFLEESLLIFCISVMSIATSFSFIILLNILPFFLMSLNVCQSCVSLQRINFKFHWLKKIFFHLYFIYFCSNLYDFFHSDNFRFSLFSTCFRCKIRFFYLEFFLFPDVSCLSINFPLRTGFVVSHRFWTVVFSLSCVARYFKISLIFSVIHRLFSGIMFSLYVFLLFTMFFLIVDFCLITLW